MKYEECPICGKELIDGHTHEKRESLAKILKDGKDLIDRIKQRDRITQLETENKRLREALEKLLDHYLELANSGDAGFWDPEKELEVIGARKALSGGE
jgi:DNA repair exonuclease SbcCD ATPase subunit